MRTIYFLLFLTPIFSLRFPTDNVNIGRIPNYAQPRKGTERGIEEPPLPKPSKIREFVRMARINSNALPITVLSLLSGYVTNPTSVSTWILSPPFLAAYTIVQSISAASMMLNDIQDIEVDRINNPGRPLVAGTVHICEAKAAVCALFSLACFLGIRFLPPVLDPFWSMAIVIVTVYTPVLKKITVIKNVSCATVVSSSVPFIGWATINPLLHELPNFRTMFYTWKILFLTSLYIEILLDMVDKKGDQEMGIRTLPVVFGERGSWICLTGILTAGYTHLYGSGLPIPSLVVTAVPMYLNLLYIYWSQFSRDAIKATFKYTTVIMVLYFVTLLV